MTEGMNRFTEIIEDVKTRMSRAFFIAQKIQEKIVPNPDETRLKLAREMLDAFYSSPNKVVSAEYSQANTLDLSNTRFGTGTIFALNENQLVFGKTGTVRNHRSWFALFQVPDKQGRNVTHLYEDNLGEERMRGHLFPLRLKHYTLPNPVFLVQNFDTALLTEDSTNRETLFIRKQQSVSQLGELDIKTITIYVTGKPSRERERERERRV